MAMNDKCWTGKPYDLWNQPPNPVRSNYAKYNKKKKKKNTI